MASWFRAAEELFEVVDRRAKQVTDDLLVGQSAATDLGVLKRVLATSPLAKGQKISAGSSVSPTQANGVGNDFFRTRSLESTTGTSDRIDTMVLAKDEIDLALKNSNHDSIPPSEFKSPDHSLSIESRTSSSQITTVVIPESNVMILEVKNRIDADGASSHTFLNGSANLHDTLPNSVDDNSLEFVAVKTRLVAENGAVSVELVTENVSNQEVIIETNTEEPAEDKVQVLEKVVDVLSPISEQQVPLDDLGQKESSKVEEQVDEAQGLLKTAVSSGQSKEARLARVCAGLSSRLQEYKTENAQLEALIQKEREDKSSIEMRIQQMQSELASAKATTSSVESETSAALASKNAEIEVLMSSLEAMKKQATIAEGKLAALQANMEAMARSRDMTESGMIQTLRDELEAAERRAEEEYVAHNATRKAAVQRETELEQRVADVTAALTRMQRTVDERTQRAAELEQKWSILEIDCASLNQEVQEMEARLRREQKRPPEEAAQALQAWREDADRARSAQREAEGRLSAMEAENQKLRVELARLKRDAENFSKQAHVELEKRFRELTELLYSKQTQLEAMASEKAAAVFQLEKELRKSREAQAEAEQHKIIRHSNAGWDDENDIKPLVSLGLQQRHLVGPSFRKAAKLLDSGAVTAGKFLWRRPLARLAVLLYLVCVHVFLLYLLHRLQEQVDNSMSSKEEIEAAAAAGLVKVGMHT